MVRRGGDNPDAQSPDGYDAHREAMASKSRERSAAGRDIAPIPEVVNPSRRESCKYDLKLFCETYLKSMFPKPWASFHLTALKLLQDLILRGGMFANAIPRASGKSAICIAAIIWCGCYGHKPYAAVICAVDKLAGDFIQDIKTQLEVNELLLDDFPAICYPIRCLERLTQRAKGQTVKGNPTRIVWTDETIVFPYVEGAESSSFRITTVGITGAIRGLRFTNGKGEIVRPAFVIIDDPQTDETAKSVTQTEDRIDITDGAILGLVGPGETMGVAMAVTVIRKGDYADHYLAEGDWQGQRQGLLSALPDKGSMEYWHRYREIQLDSIANKLGTGPENEYYAKHRKPMDGTIIATWESRFDPTRELSAIQAAMNLFFKVKARKFWAEYMNQPEALDDGEIFKLDPAAVRNRLSKLPRYQVPLGFNRLTAMIDVQMRILFYVVIAWKEDFSGSIIDYGWCPEQPRRTFDIDDLARTLQSESKAIDADLYAAWVYGLTEIGKEVLDRDYFDENGMKLNIKRCHVDINYPNSEEAVGTFCRQSKWASILTPSRGQGEHDNKSAVCEWVQRPLEEWPAKEEKRECNWMVSAMTKHKIRECMFDANHWKTHVNTAFSLPLGAAGSLNIYGENPEEHVTLSQHITSHYSVRQMVRGQLTTRWKLRKGETRDDLLDAIVGCCVAASRDGLRMRRVETVLPKGPSPKKRVFALPGGRR